MNNFIIFDRDGTLIEHEHYLIDPKLIRISEKTILGLKILNSCGVNFGIITNQSVIGRGIASTEQVEAVNKEMLEQFKSSGIVFEFVYYCPHDPINMCGCRKPEIMLGLRAINEYQINVEKSYMIGDMDTDIKFGNSLNLSTIKISDRISDIADFTSLDLLDAAICIVGQK